MPFTGADRQTDIYFMAASSAEFSKAVEFWRAASEDLDQMPKFDSHPDDGEKTIYGTTSASIGGAL